MYLPLFKTLKSFNIQDELATEVVNAMEAHIDSRVSQATRPVLDKLDAVQGVLTAKIDAFAQIKSTREQDIEKRWVAVRWGVGTAVATAAAMLAILKALGHL